MNLRVLKKLSKRAAPLLPLLGETREQFRAERGECYHGLTGFPLKDWDRSRCHPTFEGIGDDVVYTTRAGHKVVMREPYHPLKGTVMVGAMSGGEEPEWSEETTYGALREIVYWHFVEIDGEDVTLTRSLRTPREVFEAAQDIIQGRAPAAWERE